MGGGTRPCSSQQRVRRVVYWCSSVVPPAVRQRLRRGMPRSFSATFHDHVSITLLGHLTVFSHRHLVCVASHKVTRVWKRSDHHRWAGVADQHAACRHPALTSARPASTTQSPSAGKATPRAAPPLPPLVSSSAVHNAVLQRCSSRLPIRPSCLPPLSRLSSSPLLSPYPPPFCRWPPLSWPP